MVENFSLHLAAEALIKLVHSWIKKETSANSPIRSAFLSIKKCSLRYSKTGTVLYYCMAQLSRVPIWYGIQKFRNAVRLGCLTRNLASKQRLERSWY